MQWRCRPPCSGDVKRNPATPRETYASNEPTGAMRRMPGTVPQPTAISPSRIMGITIPTANHAGRSALHGRRQFHQLSNSIVRPAASVLAPATLRHPRPTLASPRGPIAVTIASPWWWYAPHLPPTANAATASKPALLTPDDPAPRSGPVGQATGHTMRGLAAKGITALAS
jgi:hypothetical protein